MRKFSIISAVLLCFVCFFAYSENIPKDFIYVAGGTVKGNVKNSCWDEASFSLFPGVFIDGRTVEISDFYICDHEVTQKEYKDIMGRNPAKDYGVGDNYPVYFVSWFDAIVYCNKRSIKEGLTPCYKIKGETDPAKWGTVPERWNKEWNSVEWDKSANGYRLPTEAEWEYAARGGAKTYGTSQWEYEYSGSDSKEKYETPEYDSAVDKVGWYKHNIQHHGVTSTEYDSDAYYTFGNKEVKKKGSNALGIYDMSGGVWEYCWEWYDRNIETGSTKNPSGPDSGRERVIRGGSWNNGAYALCVSSRASFTPSDPDYNIGIRLVRNAKQAEPPKPQISKTYKSRFPDDYVLVTGWTIEGSEAYKLWNDDDYAGSFIEDRIINIKDFYICNHEVTQQEYGDITGNYFEKPFNIGDKVGNDYPVFYINWYEAIAYCNLLSIKEGYTPCYIKEGSRNPEEWGELPSFWGDDGTWGDIQWDKTADGYRLPTEVEWEYAARGGFDAYGTEQWFYTYSGADSYDYEPPESDSELDKTGWYGFNTRTGISESKVIGKDEDGYGIQKIKSKKPNSLGLYDMSGNVWEWCWDCYGELKSNTPDTGISGSSYDHHSERGGSYSNPAKRCSVTARAHAYSGDSYNNLGFRLVRNAW